MSEIIRRSLFPPPLCAYLLHTPALKHTHPTPNHTQSRAAAEVGYLAGGGPEGLGQLRYVALFCSEDAAPSAETGSGAGARRAVYALLLPAQQSCLVVVVQRAMGAGRDVGPGLLERSWREALEVLGQQGHNSQEQVGAVMGGGWGLGA